MEPRRSSRAASAKPTKKAAPKPVPKKAASEKPPSRSASKKRVASPERDPSPPSKRTRREEQNVAPTKSKPNSKAAGKSAAENAKRSRAKLAPIAETDTPASDPKLPKPAHVQLKPYLNPLPSPPEKIRPGLQLFVWGAGNFGQFGLGPDVLGEFDKPKRHTWAEKQMQDGTFGAEGAGLEEIAGGGMHSLFIDEKGTIWSCGINDDAALGRITQNVPDPKNPGSFLDIDELTSVPHPLQTLVYEGFRAVKIATGDSICAAVNDKGELRVWGSFRVNEGSLGFANGLKHQFIPVPILNDSLSHRPGDAEKVSDITAGVNHLLVLTTHGNIYTWGAGEQAQLGRKVLERRKIHGTVPEKVSLGSRTRKAKVIGAGSFHSFAVDDKGDVWAWGLNTMGQAGTGYETDDDSQVQLPTRVQRLSKEALDGDVVVQISGGEHHSLFLTESGKVFAVGRCNAGQIGLPDDDPSLKDRADPDFVAEPVQVKFSDDDDPIVHISVGSHNNLAVSKDGALYCWGQGTQGELGVSDVEVRTPRVIVRRAGGLWAAVKVACGGQHTLGLFRRK
ncbi:regulator of chromosome condensation 1/beta-lactamase-inhibitor protein II [Lentinula aciculospora]|uniref:Regulator of chromosome condensation 1/beta-lactamase-inhibitor protein II n=1 Tax=Lentinula aciculospora TaxID=153920 RepID=A0A9W9AEP2_9AGAR|nr:regulator of chromosome condensation 1/beta-lactamase-inhibitor protein II [Lentinula aciculospora]